LVKHPKPVAALFGGSFDPPHKGHKAIVEAALSSLPVDTVILEPAWRNPFKTGFYAPPKLRLTWVRTLFDAHPGVTVDDFEIRQQRSVRTHETLRRLRDRFDVRYLIVGADNLESLPRWAHFDELNRTITWVIAARPGHRLDTSALRHAEILDIDVPVSSTQIRESGDTTHVPDAIAEDVAAFYHHKGEA